MKIMKFIKNNRRITIPIAVLLVLLLAVGIYFAASGSNNKKETESPQIEKQAIEQDVQIEDLKLLEEKGILTGFQDVKVEKGAKGNLNSLVSADKNYVKTVSVDDSNVDYNKEGTYQAVYTITFDGPKLQNFLKDENLTVAFDIQGDTVIIKVPVNVTVVAGKDSEEKAEEGNQSTAKETESQNIQENKSQGTNGGNSGSNSSSSSSNSSNHLGGSNVPSSSHEHNWVTHTETVQQPQKVYVTSEKREYTLYRFYWHNTRTWEESRDHNRFDEWYKSEYGGLFYAMHPYDNPEDDLLFIKYDNNGNPTYYNDHTITSNLFEWVPCEPYEKTEMTTVTITTTTCSICGATK